MTLSACKAIVPRVLGAWYPPACAWHCLGQRPARYEELAWVGEGPREPGRAAPCPLGQLRNVPHLDRWSIRGCRAYYYGDYLGLEVIVSKGKLLQ